jgi:hypothetical protein
MVNPMRTAFYTVVFLLAQVVSRGADTAYTALRLVGKKNGAQTLDSIVELRGRGGAPAPEVWKIVIDDPKARGGIREVEVQHGRIIGERTPTGRPLGQPMNFNQLNLDSEGVFTIANQEAQKAAVPFERVDYLLKSGTNGGAPVWQLKLLDGRGAEVGMLQIAADSGAILRQSGLVAGGRANPRENDRAYVEGPREREPAPYDEPGYERSGGSGLPGFLRRVARHFERRGQQINNYFTGREGPERDRDER